MRFVRGLFNTIVGLVFGALSAVAMLPLAAALNMTASPSGSSLLVGVAVFGAAFGGMAPTIRNAFGRSFLTLGITVFALPLSVMIMSGWASSEVIAQYGGDAEAIVGTGMVSMLMTGASAVIGFFLGGILLVVGLLLSLGDRQPYNPQSKARP